MTVHTIVTATAQPVEDGFELSLWDALFMARVPAYRPDRRACRQDRAPTPAALITDDREVP
jgi:hypothetical protein